jgi:hypothetical protein
MWNNNIVQILSSEHKGFYRKLWLGHVLNVHTCENKNKWEQLLIQLELYPLYSITHICFLLFLSWSYDVDSCQVHIEFHKKLVFIGIIHYLHTNISGSWLKSIPQHPVYIFLHWFNTAFPVEKCFSKIKLCVYKADQG